MRAWWIVLFPALLMIGCGMTLPHGTPSPRVISPAPTLTLAPPSTPLPVTASASAIPTATPSHPSQRDLEAMGTPTRVPTLTPSLTPTLCLEQVAPLKLPPRKTPLQVKFIDDGNIWTWEEQEGVARQITNTGDARSMYFSPDGQVIAFERSVDRFHVELWAVDRDGKKLRRLITVQQFNAMGSDPNGIANVPIDIQWIPRTHILTFRARPELDAIGYVEYPGQWSVDADTARLRVLRQSSAATEPRQAMPSRSPSPDGQYVALVNEDPAARKIFVSLAHADGTNRRDHLLTMPLIGMGHGSVSGSIFWSRDSRSLRAIVPSLDSPSGGPGETLTTWIIPVDGSPRPLHTFSGFPIAVDLSPNQEYLAFWRPVEFMSNLRELHLAKFDGSREIIYQTGYVLEFKGWAPDSYHFVFWYDQSHELLLGSICGAFAPLTDTPVAYGIEWVDSTRFLYASGKDKTEELRLGRIGGPSILIGGLKGDYATFQFNREPSAVGEIGE